ncbi:MAG: hypothetical protein AB7T15_06430 [Desulfuromonas sp.]
MNKPSIPSPWPEAAQKLAHSAQSVAFTQNQQLALQVVSDILPILLSGQSGIQLTAEQLGPLCIKLGNCNATDKKERFNFLARGIEWGNRHLEWDVPLSPLFYGVKRQRNLLQPKLFQCRHLAEDLAAAFLNELQHVPCSRSEAIGHIFFSAILFGGLINTRWHQPFISALNQNDIFQEGSWLWVEMTSLAKKHTATRQGRWVADPLTHLLIYRFLDLALPTGTENPKKKSPWQLLEAICKKLPLPVEKKPRSLSELLRWAMAREVLRSSSSMLSYAKGDLESFSLPIGPWLRILTGKAISIRLPQSQHDAGVKIQHKTLLPFENTTTAAQIKLLKKAQRLLSIDRDGKEITVAMGRKRLKTFFDEYHQQLAPTMQLLTAWGCQMLSPKISRLERRTAHPIKVSSLLRYWSEIGHKLVRAFGVENPLLLDPQDLEWVYEAIAQELGSDPYAVHRLAQFHGFLEAFYQAPEMEWAEIVEGQIASCSGVDANLVSPATYDALLNSLGWSKPEPSRWQTLHLLATILSYRCGLRPVEVRALRIIDIQGVSEWEVLVRNSSFKTTKTSAGIRRLPLSLLLNQQEMSFLLHYLDQRKQETALFGEELFLANPARKKGMLSDGELFGVIREHLRLITQDESVRSYHLRHSFLTWRHVGYFLYPDSPAKDVAALQHQEFDSLRLRALHEQLLQQPDTGRSQAYLLALLAGHSSPTTTFKSYIHFLDWLNGYERRQASYSYPFSAKTIMAISGLSQPRAYAVLQQSLSQKTHPLLPILLNRASIYATRLRHPLMDKARVPCKIQWREKSSPIKCWAEIVGHGNEHLPENLKKSLDALTRPDWELAVQVYESIRQLDGRRIKSAKKIIQLALNCRSARWSDSCYGSLTDLAELVELILECGIPKRRILLVHHARRGQEQSDRRKYLVKWATATKLPVSQITSGEESNLKSTDKKGSVTIKILNDNYDEGEAKKKRGKKGSSGFYFALRLLHQQFSIN